MNSATDLVLANVLPIMVVWDDVVFWECVHLCFQVMEAFRKVQAAKQKKKPPTKKERDAALKALKEREIIVKQLEAATE